MTTNANGKGNPCSVTFFDTVPAQSEKIPRRDGKVPRDAVKAGSEKPTHEAKGPSKGIVQGYLHFVDAQGSLS